MEIYFRAYSRLKIWNSWKSSILIKNIKYFIFKSKRECYDIRIIDKEIKIKKEIVVNDIKQARQLANISDLLYVDVRGKLCCTETLDSAINLIKYNDKK